jgi:hypothetical protein
MPVADLDILRRDLAVYLTTIVRMLNAPLHPFDYTAAVDEIRSAVAQYQQAARGGIDFGSMLDELSRLNADIVAWRARAEAAVASGAADAGARRRMNAVLRRLARWLVPLNYAKGERFDHDPAIKFGAVPKLEAAAGLPSTPPEAVRFLKAGLMREANKVRAALRAARRELAS